MKTIKIMRGQYFALIDDSDFDLISNYNWTANTSDGIRYYARTSKSPLIYMHFMIMGKELANYERDHVIHHIDDNGLNNQRHNLQIVTREWNAFHKRQNRPWSQRKQPCR
jgi:hypothetical protein